MISTLDVCDYSRFTLIVGVGGLSWVRAAGAVASELGVPIQTARMGLRQAFDDIDGKWSRMREVSDRGCLLVRPDRFIAWRRHDLPSDPTAALHEAMLSCWDVAAGSRHHAFVLRYHRSTAKLRERQLGGTSIAQGCSTERPGLPVSNIALAAAGTEADAREQGRPAHDAWRGEHRTAGSRHPKYWARCSVAADSSKPGVWGSIWPSGNSLPRCPLPFEAEVTSSILLGAPDFRGSSLTSERAQADLRTRLTIETRVMRPRRYLQSRSTFARHAN
jgi:hypothetical protein